MSVHSEGEEEIVDTTSPTREKSTATMPIARVDHSATTENVPGAVDSGLSGPGPGPRTRSSRIAAVKARESTARQISAEQGQGEDESGSKSEYDSSDKDDEEDGKIDEGGILVDAKGKEWLKIGDEFPWDDVEWFIDDSVDEEMRIHLGRRIKKMEGYQVNSPTEADVILVNPHPDQLAPERAKGLSNLGNVKSGLTSILPYNWLSRCYFTKKVQSIDASRLPIFLDEQGAGLRVMVGKLGEGLAGDQERRKVMIDLEAHGALIVSSWNQTQICILPSSHPYLSNPPQEEQIKHVSFRSPEWVNEKIKSASQRSKSKSTGKSKGKGRGRGKRRGEGTNIKRKHPKTEKKVPVERKMTVKREGRIKRTEFDAHDRDRLARWIAYHRPTEVGRITRSLYDKLQTYSPTHPFFPWASRHPSTAWHEHYKRSRSKIGSDGKILEDEIERYVNEEIDKSLKTKYERGEGQGQVKGKARKTVYQPPDNDDEQSDTDSEHGQEEVKGPDPKGIEKKTVTRKGKGRVQKIVDPDEEDEVVDVNDEADGHNQEAHTAKATQGVEDMSDGEHDEDEANGEEGVKGADIEAEVNAEAEQEGAEEEAEEEEEGEERRKIDAVGGAVDSSIDANRPSHAGEGHITHELVHREKGIEEDEEGQRRSKRLRRT
ncbi:uncharacterized protein IL334_006833 [Kwoniella shivajii]|uniref:BRCT domain-containing protein n=1 Tax=Kwoniella shivajii TaxID=564305 RepID=A0ABZ1D8A8_9TREE|nr:hypothetical protein IL334_006833 [Kwoniella shivajii]